MRHLHRQPSRHPGHSEPTSAHQDSISWQRPPKRSTSSEALDRELQFRWIPGTCRSVRKQKRPDKQPKKPPAWDKNTQQPEPTTLRTLMATTKSNIRARMKDEWDMTWEYAKHGRELHRLGDPTRKGRAQDPQGHTERSAPSSPKCVQARSDCAHTCTPSTEPTPTSASAATDHRQFDTSSWSVGNGRKYDTRCGQASLHAWTSSAFSVACQWQSKQPRVGSQITCGCLVGSYQHLGI